MNSIVPWLSSVVTCAMAVLAYLLGRWSGRLRRPYWLLGYFIPLALLILYWLAMHQPRLRVVPPLSWVMIGRPRFVYFNVLATMLLAVPLARLPQKRNRVIVGVLIAVLGVLSVVPFLAPAFDRDYLAG